VFSSSFSIILPNTGKCFPGIHFPGIHFPKGNNFPANKQSLTSGPMELIEISAS
jgi:hypothetical protein